MAELSSQTLGYNDIQDIGHGWILWKQGHLRPVGSFYIKDVFVEFGHDPTDNTVKIRRLGYLKEDYSLKKVQEFARKTIDCPFCVKGQPLEMLNLNTNKIISYLNTNYVKKEESNFMSMQDLVEMIPYLPVQIKDMLKAFLPQFVGQLINMGIGLTGIDKIVRKLLIGFGGFGAGLANEYLMPAGNLKTDFRLMTTNLLASTLDPDIYDIEKMSEELAKYIRAARFGGPLDIFKTMFQSPIERIQEAVRKITREFALPEWPKLPEIIPSFGRQATTAGFKLPEVSPPYTGKEAVITDTAYLTPGKRISGFRVHETVSR